MVAELVVDDVRNWVETEASSVKIGSSLLRWSLGWTYGFAISHKKHFLLQGMRLLDDVFPCAADALDGEEFLGREVQEDCLQQLVRLENARHWRGYDGESSCQNVSNRIESAIDSNLLAALRLVR